MTSDVIGRSGVRLSSELSLENLAAVRCVVRRQRLPGRSVQRGSHDVDVSCSFSQQRRGRCHHAEAGLRFGATIRSAGGGPSARPAVARALARAECVAADRGLRNSSARLSTSCSASSISRRSTGGGRRAVRHGRGRTRQAGVAVPGGAGRRCPGRCCSYSCGPDQFRRGLSSPSSLAGRGSSMRDLISAGSRPSRCSAANSLKRILHGPDVVDVLAGDLRDRSRMSRFCRRIRYSSRSSGPSNASEDDLQRVRRDVQVLGGSRRPAGRAPPPAAFSCCCGWFADCAGSRLARGLRSCGAASGPLGLGSARTGRGRALRYCGIAGALPHADGPWEGRRRGGRLRGWQGGGRGFRAGPHRPRNDEQGYGLRVVSRRPAYKWAIRFMESASHVVCDRGIRRRTCWNGGWARAGHSSGCRPCSMPGACCWPGPCPAIDAGSKARFEAAASSSPNSNRWRRRAWADADPPWRLACMRWWTSARSAWCCRERPLPPPTSRASTPPDQSACATLLEARSRRNRWRSPTITANTLGMPAANEGSVQSSIAAFAKPVAAGKWHRAVYAALGDMMQSDIHALAIRAEAPSRAGSLILAAGFGPGTVSPACCAAGTLPFRNPCRVGHENVS